MTTLIPFMTRPQWWSALSTCEPRQSGFYSTVSDSTFYEFLSELSMSIVLAWPLWWPEHGGQWIDTVLDTRPEQMRTTWTEPISLTSRPTRMSCEHVIRTEKHSKDPRRTTPNPQNSAMTSVSSSGRPGTAIIEGLFPTHCTSSD